ncbi:hypothetical protein I3842_07G060300 [Carya illinoinensis]|uniref:Uncharacterized protein n=1 Tax=Carya illinoinensis TaxID=32201 RepID=A0A922EJQ4_CARIL|nr:hypothetical protein I3842_07G060300 [Carya illinoinensis]
METNFLQSLVSKSPLSATLIFAKPNEKHSRIFLPRHQRSLRATPTHSTKISSSDNNNTSGDSAKPPATTPPNAVEIRFRRRSRRRSRQQSEDSVDGNGRPMKAQASASAPEPPKKWEDMSFAEKAIELYVGEKGALFWLNKFAYASIFIVIGGWILFRFVGPSLNLYQLDSAPLPPSSLFKGS